MRYDQIRLVSFVLSSYLLLGARHRNGCFILASWHIYGHCNVMSISHIISDGLKKTGRRLSLKHPNAAPSSGATTMLLQLVSNPESCVSVTSRVISNKPNLSKLLDVTDGINYLHACHTPQGGLEDPNLASLRQEVTEDLGEAAGVQCLIDDHGVLDFGPAPVAHDKYSAGVNSDRDHTMQWSAPEVLFGAVPKSKYLHAERARLRYALFFVGAVMRDIQVINVEFC